MTTRAAVRQALSAPEHRPDICVESISSAQIPSDLERQWTDLLQSSDSDCLFLTPEWLGTWLRHLSEGKRLSLLTVGSGQELIGLAPLAVGNSRFPLPSQEFLGTGFVGSDYLDIIARQGYEQEAGEAFASHLSSHRSMFRWAQTRQTGSFARAVAGRLDKMGWTVSETVTNTCPYISLTGHTWESFLGTLGAEHRYAFHRKWRRLNRDFTVRFDQVRTREECQESIDLVISLHNLRWRSRGGSDAFHTSGLVEFHREFSQLALRRDWLRLYVLRLNDKPAACIYGFLYRGKFYFYQSGLDPAFEKHSVGLVSMGLAIQSAIREGASEYDLLHGDEPYKSHWSKEHRELVRLELFPPGRWGTVCRSSTELERASRRFARRALTGLLS